MKPPLHAKGVIDAIRAGLLACDFNSRAPFPFAQWTHESATKAGRLQLRGSAGFSPASRAREPRMKKNKLN